MGRKSLILQERTGRNVAKNVTKCMPQTTIPIYGVHGNKFQVVFADRSLVEKNHNELMKVDEKQRRDSRAKATKLTSGSGSFRKGQEQIFTPERILAEKTSSSGRKLYLIKWEGYSVEESTWEPVKNLRLRNPTKKSRGD